MTPIKFVEEVVVDIETWNNYIKEDRLEALVENTAWKVIDIARNSGFTAPMKNVFIDILPNAEDEKTHETIRVTIEY